MAWTAANARRSSRARACPWCSPASGCRADVALWIGAADLVTLPSHNEGTPNVILEALASGRRVVATDVGGIPAVVNDPLFGELVPRQAAPALADALVRAIDTPYVPEEIAARAGVIGWDDSGALLHELLSAIVTPLR